MLKPSNYNHPRPGHAASPCLERRIGLWQHIGQQVARHELAVGVHNAEPFEPRSCARELNGSQLREAPPPFDARLRSRSRSSKCASGLGAGLAAPATKATGPTMAAPSKAERS